MLYSPEESEVTLVAVDVATSLAVTVTPGTLEPEGSVTTPTIPPVVNCA
jgi:hypothetical protein